MQEPALEISILFRLVALALAHFSQDVEFVHPSDAFSCLLG